MHPRPLYRSLVFWLGLPGLLFLLWGWADSRLHSSSFVSDIEAKTNVGSLFSSETIWHQGSQLTIGWHDFSESGLVSLKRTDHKVTRQLLPTPPWFPRPALIRHELDRSKVYMRFLVIPHWLIVGLYLVLWLLFLAWRHRRINRSRIPPAS